MLTLMLPVKERVEEQHKLIVTYNGHEYPVREMRFQQNAPCPKELACVIKMNADRHVLEVKQDYRPYLTRTYNIGECYDFHVRSDHSSSGYYEVIDENGFFTRINNCPHLEVGQCVTCRVVQLRDFQLELEFLQIKNDNSDLTRLTEKLISHCQGKEPFEQLVHILLDTEETYAENKTTWLAHIATADCDEAINHLTAVRDFCLYILEGSDLLRTLNADTLRWVQERLGHMADDCRLLTRTVSIIKADKADDIISDMLDRLYLSGYLYNAAHELRLLEALLRLCPDMANRYVSRIFEVVRKADNTSLRESEPFRSAFIRILENYIRACRHTIDNADSIEGDDDTQRSIYNAIEALAIQHLLGKGLAEPNYDRALNRALFYRYLSYTKGANTDMLLEKAYRCLVGEWVTMQEFSWNDVNSPLLMAQKAVSLMPATTEAAAARRYESEQATLELTDSVTILPNVCPPGATPQNALPANLLPWHNLQVKLNANIHLQKWQDASNLQPYKQMWNDIERHLFTPKEVAPRPTTIRKQLPDVGDVVNIRITAPTTYTGEFACRIEDERYEGEGIINVENIVQYNPHASRDSFRDDEGRPLLLEASVAKVDNNDQIEFKMKSVLSKALAEEDYISYEADYVCVVTSYSAKRRSYACISSDGINFSVAATPDMPQLQCGSFCRVRLSERNNFAVGQHEAIYAGSVVDEHFTVADAFRTLMIWYSAGESWQPTATEMPSSDTDIMQADDLLAAGHVGELMMLIDRKAVTTTDYFQAYNYLGMARIVARLLNNERQADYYAKRMKLIMMLQHFEANGAVEGQELHEFSEMDGNVVSHYKGLYVQFRRLQAVSYLRRDDRNEELWTTAHEAKDPILARLATLVLTYNLLGEFKLQAGQKGVHTKINELLNIREKESDLKPFGEESLHTEFKTSIVFPPDNNMHDDIEQQTQKILEVICGFLNADGGTLYLGVNNEGLGVGLATDLNYRLFKDSGNPRDKYDRYIIDRVRLRLGLDAGLCVNGEFIDANGRSVYRLTIKPCNHVIKFDDRCFRRIGSETVELVGEALRHFEAEHVAAFVSNKEANATSANAVQQKPKLPPIATATPQPSATDSYPTAYLYFLEDNSYMCTQEPYRGPARLQLTINAANEDGCLVIVYTDGAALRVPTANLLKCKLGQHYNLYRDKAGSKDIAFAALAHPDDLLMTTRRDARGRFATRMDTVERIESSDLLNAKGTPLVAVTAELHQCDIVPAYNKGTFKKITDIAPTTIGSDLTLKSYNNMADGLSRLGIELEQ